MTDSQNDYNAAELEDDGVLDPVDTLDGEPGHDPLDAYAAPDRWSAAERFGTTSEEERRGETFDQLLAEEEPDVDPYAEEVPDLNEADEAPAEGLADPRAGRLVAEDEGAHPDEEPDLVARDVGIDAGGAGAEEAAIHVFDEPADDE